MRRAFTLIELMLVMAIMLGLGISGSLYYSRFLASQAVDTTQDQIIQDIRKAQSYAMVSRGSTGAGWGIYYDGIKNIILYQGPNYTGRDPTRDEKISVSANVTITGLADINFSRIWGMPNPAGATITISGTNGKNRTITVNSLGIASR